MPFLLVNLEDPMDCRKAIQQLKGRARAAADCGPMGGRWAVEPRVGNVGPGLNLGQKLRRIRHRGLWKHLVAVAQASPEARSLNEWDQAIGLPPNKMRSLKAIMAKLEHRFGLRFLEPSIDAGVDASGNPRYAMPQRVRQVILRLATEPEAG
jgi:hypothetical protein